MVAFLQENLPLVSEIALSVILVASIVVKITPNTKDDSVMRKIIELLDKLSIAKTADDKNILNKAKANLKDNENK